MTAKELAYKAAIELNLPPKYVWEVYKSYWIFIRNHISSLQLKDIKDENGFNVLKTNINVPSLGKFHIEWDRIQNKRKENERYKNYKD
jgi:hypothetical protein